MNVRSLLPPLGAPSLRRPAARAQMKRIATSLFIAAVLSILLMPVTAQQSWAHSAGKVYKVGFLAYGRPRPADAPPLEVKKMKGPVLVFLQHLAKLGYVQGKNLLVELRLGDYGQLKALAIGLARENVDVILTAGARASRIAQQAVKTTPLVFLSCDPYEHVTQLAHPGRNITGSTCMSTELSPKRLELLEELVPKASRVAYFSDGRDPVAWKRTHDAAPRLGITLKAFTYVDRKKLPDALSAVARWKPDAMFVFADATLIAERKRLADFARHQRLPAIYTFPVFAESGGLISYGSSLNEMFVLSAEQVAAILGGANPGDVPVRRAKFFHLVVNLKTAGALNLQVPPLILLQADRVIK